MTDSPMLDRNAIEQALRLLGDRLVKQGVIADLYVFGGAAMALAYDSRRTTRDIDAVFRPHGVVLAEARAVGRKLGLPDWWLNEQGSVYASSNTDKGASRVFDHPGLRVQVASPRHLLAMKVLASRRPDAPDIRILVEKLGLNSAAEVLTVCEEVFPEEPVPDRARLLLEDVFQQISQDDA